MHWAVEVYTTGDPTKPEFVYKKLCMYSYMFKIQSSSKNSIWCSWDVFFHCSKYFLNSSIPFNAFTVLRFIASTLEQSFPLRIFFTLRNEKSHSREIRWLGRVGHWGDAIFGQKLLNTQHGVGRCTCKSPLMKWAKVLTESSKKFTEAKRSLSQQRQLEHYYRWVHRTPT